MPIKHRAQLIVQAQFPQIRKIVPKTVSIVQVLLGVNKSSL
jgi:hypothetical protein